MVQLEVEGIFLDLYEDDPIKINITFDDFQFGVVSDYSKTFRVPATKHNNTFFRQAFEVNDIDFDITSKRIAHILVDGIEYKQGELRLLKIYLSDDGKYADYECLFLGEKKEFQSTIGEKTLCQLNLETLRHSLTYANISKSWEAYPSGTTTSGLFNGDVLYPLCDFGNSYTSTTGPSIYLPTIPLAEYPEIGAFADSYFSYSPQTYFTASTSPLEHNRFKPMIRAKKIIDQIFEDAGFTYTSNFFNTNFFRKLYVSAWGNEPSFQISGNSNNFFAYHISAIYANEQNLGEDITKLQFLPEEPAYYDPFLYGPGYDYGDNWSAASWQYNCPLAGNYSGQLQFFTQGAQTGNEFVVRIHKFSGGIETTLAESPLLTQPILFWNGTFSGSFNIFDKIYVKVYNSGTTAPYVSEATWFKIDGPGTIYPSGFLKCDFKQVDFLKDIITKFRMVMIPNGINSFLIEPWNDIIGQGTIYDWTDKLDNTKDVILEPTFYSQKKTLIFQDQTDSDIASKWYSDTSIDKLPYGYRKLTSTYDLLFDTQTISTNFASIPLTHPYFFNESSFFGMGGMRYMVIPSVFQGTIPQEHYIKVKTPIAPKTRLLFYNGMARTDATSAQTYNNTWYIRNDSGGAVAMVNKFPSVSNYSEYPISGATDINWGKSRLYVVPEQGGSGQPYAPSQTESNTYNNFPKTDVYEVYWQDYISNLYNKNGRILTAYFKLNFEDVRNLEPGDVIFLKNSYWYIKSINELAVGRDELVKVELVKLVNYRPSGEGYIPPASGLWNLDASIWNLDSTTWDS